MRDFSPQGKKSAIVFQMEMDPDLMWERQVSTLCRGTINQNERFFHTKSKISTCLPNENGPRFDVGALAKYSI